MAISTLDAESIRLMCSGQVVVDLASAVKELVENALDASATSVDVRLVDYGASEIECSDDGCGIASADFASIVERHKTSKLREFSALQTINSFGFRGEALASLCELAEEFWVVTRCASERVGARLAFSRDGSIISATACARSVGTTVKVKGLFKNLPVRRADFVRNKKRHYTKALRMMHAYTLIATHCRLRVVLDVTGKRSTVIAVQGKRTVKESVSSLFGVKLAQSLDQFERALDEGHNDPPRSITGLVSRAGVGVGRSEGDRQFLFCNGRPIDAPKFVRAVNDTWRTFEIARKPAFFIDVSLPRDKVDINVSPNKREVFFDNEASILDGLKVALTSTWEDSRGRLRSKQSDAIASSVMHNVSTAACNVDNRIQSPPGRTQNARENTARAPPTYLGRTKLSCNGASRMIQWQAATAPSSLQRSKQFAAQLRRKRMTVLPYLGAPSSLALTKGDFSKMEIIGQFNLGFLVCKLNEHMFVVDQHAADEKSRYEFNWKNTKIQTQPLLAPKTLELGIAEELAFVEMHGVFKKNGFAFVIDKSARVGTRVKILGVPSAKGVTFGITDAHELVSILAGSESTCIASTVKLPGLHALFASKACRSAIMIGTALKMSEMSRLLVQLAILDQPWNCPHGRPTIRHLGVGPGNNKYT